MKKFIEFIKPRNPVVKNQKTSGAGYHSDKKRADKQGDVKHKKSFKDIKEEVEICETADAGLAAKAAKSGISIGTLRKVYKRGVAAWNSGHRPGTTPQQWGMARVNSYITKGQGTYHGADKDLREEEPEVPKDKESGLPKKYVAGLSDATAKARAAHFAKADKLSDRDPSAYKPAPGDATAKTKLSKHTLKYRAMFGEDMHEEIYEACWDTHKQIGMKKKGNRMVPNCVPRNEEKDEREYGYEGDMAISQLKTLVRHSEMLLSMLKPETDLPEWVQSKITLATDYIQTSHDYLMSEEEK